MWRREKGDRGCAAPHNIGACWGRGRATASVTTTAHAVTWGHFPLRFRRDAASRRVVIILPPSRPRFAHPKEGAPHGLLGHLRSPFLAPRLAAAERER